MRILGHFLSTNFTNTPEANEVISRKKIQNAQNRTTDFTENTDQGFANILSSQRAFAAAKNSAGGFGQPGVGGFLWHGEFDRDAFFRRLGFQVVQHRQQFRVGAFGFHAPG